MSRPPRHARLPERRAEEVHLNEKEQQLTRARARSKTYKGHPNPLVRSLSVSDADNVSLGSAIAFVQQQQQHKQQQDDDAKREEQADLWSLGSAFTQLPLEQQAEVQNILVEGWIQKMDQEITNLKSGMLTPVYCVQKLFRGKEKVPYWLRSYFPNHVPTTAGYPVKKLESLQEEGEEERHEKDEEEHNILEVPREVVLDPDYRIPSALENDDTVPVPTNPEDDEDPILPRAEKESLQTKKSMRKEVHQNNLEQEQEEVEVALGHEPEPREQKPPTQTNSIEKTQSSVALESRGDKDAENLKKQEEIAISASAVRAPDPHKANSPKQSKMTQKRLKSVEPTSDESSKYDLKQAEAVAAVAPRLLCRPRSPRRAMMKKKTRVQDPTRTKTPEANTKQETASQIVYKQVSETPRLENAIQQTQAPTNTISNKEISDELAANANNPVAFESEPMSSKLTITTENTQRPKPTFLKEESVVTESTLEIVSKLEEEQKQDSGNNSVLDGQKSPKPLGVNQKAQNLKPTTTIQEKGNRRRAKQEPPAAVSMKPSSQKLVRSMKQESKPENQEAVSTAAGRRPIPSSPKRKRASRRDQRVTKAEKQGAVAVVVPKPDSLSKPSSLKTPRTLSHDRQEAEVGAAPKQNPLPKPSSPKLTYTKSDKRNEAVAMEVAVSKPSSPKPTHLKQNAQKVSKPGKQKAAPTTLAKSSSWNLRNPKHANAAQKPQSKRGAKEQHAAEEPDLFKESMEMFFGEGGYWDDMYVRVRK